MCIEGATVGQWVKGVKGVGRMRGRSKQGQALVRFGIGNAWVKHEMKLDNATKVARKYGELAQKMM